MLVKSSPRMRAGEIVLNGLLSLLNDGSFKVGAQIPSEAELGQQFGVSRVTLREAMKAIAAMGLVEVVQGKGTFVKARSTSPLIRPVAASIALENVTVFELIDVRRVIELETVERAAVYRNKKDLAELRRIVAEMEAPVVSPERYIDLDAEFHLRISLCAKNRVLSSVLRWIRDQLREDLLQTAVKNGKIIEWARSGHRKMLNAIESRDRRRAARLMTQHLKQLEQEFAELPR